jgi:hypothetical protein
MKLLGIMQTLALSYFKTIHAWLEAVLRTHFCAHSVSTRLMRIITPVLDLTKLAGLQGSFPWRSRISGDL